MKGLARAPAVQSLLAWLTAGYVEMLIATVRWRYDNRAAVDLAVAAPEGAIALFWHGRIAQGMACRRLLGGKPRRVMISLSRDGEFIAMAAERLRIPTVRGSTGRGEGPLGKGGASAFRQALAFVKAGGVMILTPDGPRGPREVLPPGSAQLARAAGCPVFLMSLAARPALVLKSWDRTVIPLPFARGQVVLEGPLRVAPHADEAAVEAARADWQGRMRAGQARAEALLAGRPT
ncbi:MAG: lysophospholipid acyltransferase family protein [Caulobacteraceae bacterium]